MNRIYLDHNATTPMLHEAAEAMQRAWSCSWGNPASQHAAGRQARQSLEDARDTIGVLLGVERAAADADQVIFTSGGTEANNLAIFGLAGTRPAHAIVSAIEHPSVLGAAEQLARLGWSVEKLPTLHTGVVEVDCLGDMLRNDTRLVCLMLGNNETGVLQDVARAAAICRERGVPLHCDAVQVAGKLPIDFGELGAATLSISAHKFHGPVGIGALVVRSGVRIAPILHGGFQQGGLRPGTEPVALVMGMCAALEHWQNNRNQIPATLSSIRDAFERELRTGWDELAIQGQNAPRLPHTSSVAFVGLDRQTLMMAFDLAGVACSTGSACASGSSEPSHVLAAMGCPRAVVEGALRFSFGQTSTLEEALEAARRILKICNDLRAEKSLQKTPFGGREPESILLE